MLLKYKNIRKWKKKLKQKRFIEFDKWVTNKDGSYPKTYEEMFDLLYNNEYKFNDAIRVFEREYSYYGDSSPLCKNNEHYKQYFDKFINDYLNKQYLIELIEHWENVLIDLEADTEIDIDIDDYDTQEQIVNHIKLILDNNDLLSVINKRLRLLIAKSISSIINLFKK